MYYLIVLCKNIMIYLYKISTMSATKTDIPSPSEILAMRDAYNKEQLVWQTEYDRLEVENQELTELHNTLFRMQRSNPQDLSDNDRRAIEYYTRSNIYKNERRALGPTKVVRPDMLRPHFFWE
jgi:hypothetical protein